MSRAKRALRRIERAVRESRAYLRSAFASDYLLAILLSRRVDDRRGDVHLLLPTAGRGNIGDQAMFESFALNTDGPIIALVRNKLDFDLSELGSRDLRLVEVPRLVPGGRFGRKRDVIVFLRLLSKARSFSVIGADVMDGGYERGEAVRRAQLLRLAARAGVHSRVVGFSWNGRADPVVTTELRRASRRSELYARDPLSLTRLHNDGIEANESADVVFLHGRSVNDGDLTDWFDEDPRPVVTINVSGLISRTLDLRHEFADVVRETVAKGHRVVLLPHVIRPGDDDLAACRGVVHSLGAVDPHSITLVERTLSPSEVASIAARSVAVITGRMHLAILALSQGTVPITLATQGKVEGLARLFDIDDLVLAPESGVGSRAIAALFSVLSSTDYSDRVQARLPEVKRLSRRSFEGLTTS